MPLRRRARSLGGAQGAKGRHSEKGCVVFVRASVGFGRSCSFSGASYYVDSPVVWLCPDLHIWGLCHWAAAGGQFCMFCLVLDRRLVDPRVNEAGRAGMEVSYHAPKNFG